jgi:peptidoglycan-associated lipoprotein
MWRWGDSAVPSVSDQEAKSMSISLFASARAFRLAAILVGGLALGACANTQTATDGAGGSGFGAGGAATPGSAQDFVVNVGDRVFFETDSTDLTATATTTLDKQAQWLARYPRYTFTVEGHADERGTREYNFSLGARRAQTVRDYLASRGVAANRMRTVSYGKERPVAVCNDISCWSQNRRAVTLLDGAGGA